MNKTLTHFQTLQEDLSAKLNKFCDIGKSSSVESSYFFLKIGFLSVAQQNTSICLNWISINHDTNQLMIHNIKTKVFHVISFIIIQNGILLLIVKLYDFWQQKVLNHC